jgi:hypothetical protein
MFELEVAQPEEDLESVKVPLEG